MKRAWGSLIVVVVLALAALPAAAGAAEVETYVGCGVTVSTSPAHVCTLGDSPGAFFEADEDVEYDVCVEFPDTNFLCAEEQFAEAGVLYVNEITTEQVGEHFVWWFVEGEEVGAWDFRIDEPSPPPTPPVRTPPPPAPPALPLPAVGPSAACINAKAMVRTLSTQLSKATKPKRKAKLRGKLRRARTSKQRLC